MTLCTHTHKGEPHHDDGPKDDLYFLSPSYTTMRRKRDSGETEITTIAALASATLSELLYTNCLLMINVTKESIGATYTPFDSPVQRMRGSLHTG